MKHTCGVRSPVSVQMPTVGISAFFSRHAESFRMAPIANDYHKIVIITAGTGAVEMTNRALSLHRRSILLIAPGVIHRFVDDPRSPLGLAALCIRPKALTLLPPSAWDAVLRALPADTSTPIRWLTEMAMLETDHLLRRIALHSGKKSPHTAMRIAGMAAETLAVLLDGLSDEKPAAMTKSIAYSILWIDRHFTDPIRIADLASQVGLSYRAYTQQFRRATGLTVLQYITRLRIQFSIRSLLGSGDIVGSASMAGFSDLSHYYRIFKQHTGTTPHDYLKRHTQR